MEEQCKSCSRSFKAFKEYESYSRRTFYKVATFGLAFLELYIRKTFRNWILQGFCAEEIEAPRKKQRRDTAPKFKAYETKNYINFVKFAAGAIYLN